MSASGKNIYENYSFLEDDNTFEINLSNIPKGVYFIELLSYKKYYGFQKFIISH